MAACKNIPQNSQDSPEHSLRHVITPSNFSQDLSGEDGVADFLLAEAALTLKELFSWQSSMQDIPCHPNFLFDINVSSKMCLFFF